MRKAFSLIAFLIIAASAIVNATTWAPIKKRDPITNDRLQFSTPASSGSYIYQWPGKSDLVFWPYTDQNWLWFNPRSGYISFGNDFDKIDQSQQGALKAWLQENYDENNPPNSRLELLEWAEKIYSVRGMDDDFWRYFYRLMAFETRANTEVSLSYVKKDIPLLRKELESTNDQGQKMQSLYLLSEYSRRLNNEIDSFRYLEQLKGIVVQNDLAGLKNYLLSLADEQRNPTPDMDPARTNKPQ